MSSFIDGVIKEVDGVVSISTDGSEFMEVSTRSARLLKAATHYVKLKEQRKVLSVEIGECAVACCDRQWVADGSPKYPGGSDSAWDLEHYKPCWKQFDRGDMGDYGRELLTPDDDGDCPHCTRSYELQQQRLKLAPRTGPAYREMKRWVEGDA